MARCRSTCLWRIGDTVFVAEVKSITAANEEHQLRLGVGQVLRYHQAVTGTGTDAVAVLVREPTDPSWLELCATYGIVLTWPAAFDRLLARPAGRTENPQPLVHGQRRALRITGTFAVR